MPTIALGFSTMLICQSPIYSTLDPMAHNLTTRIIREYSEKESIHVLIFSQLLVQRSDMYLRWSTLISDCIL